MILTIYIYIYTKIAHSLYPQKNPPISNLAINRDFNEPLIQHSIRGREKCGLNQSRPTNERNRKAPIATNIRPRTNDFSRDSLSRQ